MPAPAAFVLDFNGTISDDEQLLEEIYQELFAGIGLELSGARYRAEFAGLSDPAIIAGGIALAGRAGEPGLAEALEQALVARYLERVADGVAGDAGRRGVRAGRRRARAGRDRLRRRPRDDRRLARRHGAASRCSRRS